MHKVNGVVDQFPQQPRVKHKAKLTHCFCPVPTTLEQFEVNPCTCADTVGAKSSASLIELSAVLLVATSFRCLPLSHVVFYRKYEWKRCINKSVWHLDRYLINVDGNTDMKRTTMA